MHTKRSCGRGGEPRVPEQRLRRRPSTPERCEHGQRVDAAAERQHGVPELAARLLHRGLVLQADILKRAKGVRGQHLRPLVAVVPRRVPSCTTVLDMIYIIKTDKRCPPVSGFDQVVGVSTVRERL